MTRIRWATFDCYGTLVDWLHGVSTSFDLLFPGTGPAAVEAFARHETQVQQEDPRQRYRSVLTETARRMAADLGVTMKDDDAGTRRRIGVPIDVAVTAEDAGAYKPSTAHFATFRDRFGVQPGDWVHVACSYYHDVEPAHGLGVPVIWINRPGQDRDAAKAAAVLPGLTSLPSTVATVMGWDPK